MPTVDLEPLDRRVTVSVQFWEGVEKLSFERAECWESVGGHEGRAQFGTCNFSILATLETPLPEASGALVFGVLALVALTKTRRGPRGAC